MKAALFTLLAILLLSDVRGQMGSRGRCKCQDAGANMILPRNIAKLEVLSPSSSCHKMEIIVTLKENGKQKCLNPNSRFAQNYIKNIAAKRNAETTAQPVM